MKRHLLTFLAFLLPSIAIQADTTLPVPDVNQLVWHEAEIGLFVHWAPNVYQNREGDNRSTPRDKINPTQLDTDQWARAATAFGARYVVLVAKHVGGYCLWQTDTTDYSIKTSPWKNGKGDVMADMAASCKKYGLHMGFYLSPRDDHFGAKIGGITADPARQEEYTRVYHTQLIELLTRYGPMLEIWFDGTIKIPVADVLAKYGPNTVTFQGPQSPLRWVGNEHGVAAYPTWNRAKSSHDPSRGSPDNPVWAPAEVDVSLRRPNWFWSTTNANRLLTLDQLVEIYYKSVGRGVNLLLNITPDRAGVVPEADMKRLEEFGAEIKNRFGTPLAATQGNARELLLEFPKTTLIDHVQLRENLKFGEQVRAFTVEGRVQEKWVPLINGTAIGNRQIIPFAALAVDAVRLRITETTGTPAIRDFSAYYVNAPLPKDVIRSGSRQPLVPPVIARGIDGTISISLPQDDLETRYTTDGTEPTRNSLIYREPQTFGTGVVRARFFRENGEQGPEVHRRFGLPANQLKLVKVSSEEKGHEGELAFDGNTATFWHTKWRGGAARPPHEIVLDLGAEKTVKGIGWLPRQDTPACQPASISIQVGNTPDGTGSSVTINGTEFKTAPLAEQWFDLPQPVRGRYLRLVISGNIAGKSDLAAAEIQVDAE